MLALTMLFIAEWTLASAFEAAAIGQPAKIFWSKLQYIGFTATPPLLLSFIWTYSHQTQWRSLHIIFALWFIPAVTLLLSSTNELHGLIWTGFSPGLVAENILIYHHGPWFWIFTVYLYTVGVVISVILLGMYRKAARIYRMQILMMFLSSLFPAVAGALYLLDINPIRGLDWTPISMAGAGVAFAWSIIRLNLLDLVPVARETLIEQIQAGIVVLDRQDRVVDVNPAARRLLGLQAVVDIGKPAALVLPVALNTLEAESQTEMHLENGEVRQIEVRMTHLKEISGEKSGQLILLYDITLRKKAEDELQAVNARLQAQVEEIRGLKDKLREESIRDPLTGLYNRRYLDETLAREISRSNRQHKPVSFMIMDADGFKRINDAYGHLYGDIVLKELAAVITENTRREDIACRFGGDEFIIVLPGTNLATAVIRAELMRQKFSGRQIAVRDQVISASFSAGVACYPDQGATVDAVMRACDEALYLAKANGCNRVEAYAGNGTP
jgi:diguanylate cyclase (GGDEF)-like protein/PAS domain S-box-containing protein